jgi:tRNA (guanine-N7-)-methyltransferase
MTSPPERLIHSYGRRRGRPLRKGRAASLAELLPRVAIAAPQDVRDPPALFAMPVSDVWLEIGFGGGEHLAWQAYANPSIGFIGCEPYVNGMAALLVRVAEGGLANLRVWPGDAREILPSLPDAGIGRAFVLFPDPWPKARHHKRRLIAPPFLDELARVLRAGAELRLATDDPAYLDWMLERACAHPAFSWTARAPEDWRTRPPDWPATRYEEKAVAGGRKPYFLRFARG